MAFCALQRGFKQCTQSFAPVGKQYRVAPGDTVRIEKSEHENGNIEFSEVIAVSGEEGKL